MELKNLSVLQTDNNSSLPGNTLTLPPKDLDVEANGHLEEDTKLLINSMKAAIVPAANN